MTQPTTTATSSCENCMFWKYLPIKQSGIAKALGSCRINPPTYNSLQPFAVDDWPLCASNAWCGNWQGIK